MNRRSPGPALLLALLVLSRPLLADDARKLLVESEARHRTKSQQYAGQLSVAAKDGKVRKKSWRSWREGYAGDAKLLIRFTKCRARHTNDNGLVESKNGSVVRKHLGYSHIPQECAELINQYARDFLNHYVNFHRPCFFPVSVIDHRGKIKKTYPYQEVMTPYEKLKSLPEAESHLLPGVTLERLGDIAHQMSDNEFAERMVKARSDLFQQISRFVNRVA